MGSGNLDGAAAVARFNAPQGIARDAAGNLYVADSQNSVVRKISAAGEVSTLAGQMGVSGSADGTGSAARFSRPFSVAVDSAGNVYVADVSRNQQLPSSVRKISPAGAVSTLPLSFMANQPAFFVGFDFGVAVDPSGNLYVATRNMVFKVTPSGVESTLTTFEPFLDPIFAANPAPPPAPPITRTPQLAGIAVQADGTVYVTDVVGHVIRRVAPNGTASVVAGREGCYQVAALAGSPCGFVPGTGDGVGQAARFFNPRWIALDAAGDLLVADQPAPSGTPGVDTLSPRVLRKVTPAGVVTTVASGLDGLGGLTVDAQGAAYISDVTYSRILKKLPDQAATAFTGTNQAPGPLFFNLAPNPMGGLFALQAGNTLSFNRARYALNLASVSPGGISTTVAQGLGGYNLPRAGLAVDAAGNAYTTKSGESQSVPFAGILEQTGQVIKVTPSGATSTFWNSADLVPARLPLDFVPARLAFDPAGSLFVAGYRGTSEFFTPWPDALPFVIKVSATGQLLGQIPLLAPGQPEPAASSTPKPPEIGTDSAGNLYVAVYNTIRKISPAGVLTVLAGATGVSGFADGAGDQARFGEIRGLAVDAAGNIYAADATSSTVRKITPAGAVTTIVGKLGSQGILLGDLPGSLATPNGLMIDASGFLYISSGQALLRVKLP